MYAISVLFKLMIKKRIITAGSGAYGSRPGRLVLDTPDGSGKLYVMTRVLGADRFVKRFHEKHIIEIERTAIHYASG